MCTIRIAQSTDRLRLRLMLDGMGPGRVDHLPVCAWQQPRDPCAVAIPFSLNMPVRRTQYRVVLQILLVNSGNLDHLYGQSARPLARVDAENTHQELP